MKIKVVKKAAPQRKPQNYCPYYIWSDVSKATTD